MVSMKGLLWLLATLLPGAIPLSADTIYQVSAQGRQVVLQRAAIVVSEDSSSLTYKHFDLQERRVTKVRLSKGSLPYFVNTSSAADRQQIVSTWKRFGYKATVVDQSGKSTRVFDVYLDFYPPGGRGSLLESIPATTSFPILLAAGGADIIEFSKIERVEIQEELLKVTPRDGQVKEGKFLYPTDKPAEARFLGITDNYNPASGDVFDFSLPLDKVKEIRFE
jgi:hypothetical protein